MVRAALGRAFTLLLAAAGLAACVADTGGGGYNQPLGLNMGPGATRIGPGTQAPGQRVSLLVPLTGSNAEVGQALLRAAQLSLDQPGGPPLDVRDTAGTPAGAAQAARAAVSGGAGIILGPLTAAETGAVAPIAREAGIPVLAFTSDVAQAQPGVWTLGVTPGQQVRRLVRAVQAEGQMRLAAVVPQNAFGDALAAGMVASAGEAGLPPPRIVRFPGAAGLSASLQEVAGSPAPGTPPSAPPAPPPIDALLLGTAGPALAQAAPTLTSFGIGPAQVRILGPALWAREAPQLGALAGAWYAAPDPASRAGFEQAYAAKYGAPPRELASLAYDAAGVARASLDRLGYSATALTRPQGFAGADGLFSLLPDGQVRRGLAIFEIDKTGAHLVRPAPSSLVAPAS